MRHVALLVAVCAAFAGVAAAVDDPDCDQPDQWKAEDVSPPMYKPSYNEDVFELMQGCGGCGAGVTNVVLKAPVHTCRIKTHVAVQQFVKTRVDGGIWDVDVQPYSQPPNLNFFDAMGTLLERVKISDEATVSDIEGFLLRRGIQPRVALPQTPPLPPAAPPADVEEVAVSSVGTVS